MALTRQRARKCLINDSTRNTSIFTEKGKESFPKGKTLFNSTDSLMSKHFTHTNIPFSTAWFVKHDESAQNSLNVYYVNNKSMILAQYLKKLITRFIKILHWIRGCRNSARCNVKRCRNSARCNVKCCRNSSRCNAKFCRNFARCNVVLQKFCTM